MLHRPYLLLPLPARGQPDHFIGSRAVTVNRTFIGRYSRRPS